MVPGSPLAALALFSARALGNNKDSPFPSQRPNMTTKTIQCPNCGQSASGQFCSHCGASLTGAPARRSAPALVSWAALAVAAAAVAVALWVWLNRAPATPGPALPPFSATLPPADAPASGAAKVDLSSMSPREAADRLFNRVMTAYENGRADEVRQFAPMAVQAYDRIGTLDNDARYHIGLLHLTARDTRFARVQAEELRKAVPKHLLAIMLEHQIAEIDGNRAGIERANKEFLAAYSSEIAVKRSEYDDHRGTIDRFRAAAQAGMGAKK